MKTLAWLQVGATFRVVSADGAALAGIAGCELAEAVAKRAARCVLLLVAPAFAAELVGGSSVAKLTAQRQVAYLAFMTSQSVTIINVTCSTYASAASCCISLMVDRLSKPCRTQ
jgi:hypothetical protein